MKKPSVGLALLALLGILSACSGDSSSPTEPGDPGRTVPLGREYELRVGETVRLAGILPVDVTLVRVFADSRCPVDVVCPTAGTVDVELRASRPPGAGVSAVVRFTGSGSQQDTVGLQGYTFRVQRVLPARRSGQDIPQSEYRVVLISNVDR